jgi:6-pyruvoyltetrahydropterin/6-carboxytetrahydropterin synthase
VFSLAEANISGGKGIVKPLRNQINALSKKEGMKTVFVTRRERFNAAHKLWNEAWSEEKNKEIFGKCANPNWHGHNYELHITVKGVPAEDTGYCMDLKDLSKIVNTRVIDLLDHKNINLDVPFMAGKMASTEVLIIAIWDQLLGPINATGCTLHGLRLYETENNYCDYFGEQ